jgi:hypothetical protein
MDLSQQDPSSSKSSCLNNFQEFVIVDEDSRQMFLENKFVQAISKAENPVSYSHFFASRGRGATYVDLNDATVEELSALKGDVFMTACKNEFYTVFDRIAGFVQQTFQGQLRTSTCGSVSVMKLENVEVHCDDDAVGEQIVVANCGDKEYNLLFYTKNEDTSTDEYTKVEYLAVKPWMMYLLSNTYRVMYHAVQNADNPRTIIRLGFFEMSSIQEYLLNNSTGKISASEKLACTQNGSYKREIQAFKTKSSDNFFGKDVRPLQPVLGNSSFLTDLPCNSGHGFLYFNPAHVCNIFGTSLFNNAFKAVEKLLMDNRTSIRNWLEP